MLVVRDRSRNGKPVSWGTDHVRMREIAASNPTAFEAWPDLGAAWFYCHVKPEGLDWVHPYDRDAQLYAEIKP